MSLKKIIFFLSIVLALGILAGCKEEKQEDYVIMHNTIDDVPLDAYEKECVAILAKDPAFLKSVNLRLMFMSLIAQEQVVIKEGWENAAIKEIKNDMTPEEVLHKIDKHTIGGEHMIHFIKEQRRLAKLYYEKYAFLADSANYLTKDRIYEGALRASDEHTVAAVKALREASFSFTRTKNREGYCYQEWLKSFNQNRERFFKTSSYLTSSGSMAFRRLAFDIRMYQNIMEVNKESYYTCSSLLPPLSNLYKWLNSQRKQDM